MIFHGVSSKLTRMSLANSIFSLFSRTFFSRSYNFAILHGDSLRFRVMFIFPASFLFGYFYFSFILNNVFLYID